MQIMALTEQEAKQFSDMANAIVSIEKILEVVLEDHKARIRLLEKHDEEFQKQVHESCDIMNQTVDSKIEKAIHKSDGEFSRRLDVMEKVYDGRINFILWCMAFLFGGWGGTIAYFNNADGKLHEKNNINREHLIENGTNIKHIQDVITKAISDGYYLTKDK